jgi:hypothetical protein
VYRATEEAIRIVLRCDEGFNFRRKVTFCKLMGFHEEIVSNNVFNCCNRNDQKSLLKRWISVGKLSQEGRPIDCRQYIQLSKQ